MPARCLSASAFLSWSILPAPTPSCSVKTLYQCRKHMGYEMAKEAPTDAELVMPFPDSGVYAAIGFAHAAGVPYEQAYIRNHYVGRTFIQPSQTMRNFGVRVQS